MTDDNTTQNVPDGIEYSNEIKTNLDDTPAVLNDEYVNAMWAKNGKPTNVMQSNSTTSATDFAAGLPLSTIFIDESMIGGTGHDNDPDREFTLLTTDPAFVGGITLDDVPANTLDYSDPDHPVMGKLVAYDPTLDASLLQVSPGTMTELNGPLFQFIYRGAAILPDGSRAHLKITYSNARIAVDQRLEVVNENYEGAIDLANGSSFRYVGHDERDLKTNDVDFTEEQIKAMDDAVLEVAQSYGIQTGVSTDNTTWP